MPDRLVLVRDVPWWGVVSSAAAPVLLVGGWTAAASLQPQFDPVAQTVSDLAALGATDRWVMTLTFVVVGCCYVVTGLALRPARRTGRLILIVASLVGMLVAAYPERAGDAYPVPHIVTAVIGLAGLVVWPAWAWRRGPGVPWALRPAVAAAVVTALVALVLWFGIELILAAGQVGLAERVAGGAQAIWPLAVVLSCRRMIARRYSNPGTKSLALPVKELRARAEEDPSRPDRAAAGTGSHTGHGGVIRGSFNRAERRHQEAPQRGQRNYHQGLFRGNQLDPRRGGRGRL
jgi:hypothetical membrane protein